MKAITIIQAAALALLALYGATAGAEDKPTTCAAGDTAFTCSL